MSEPLTYEAALARRAELANELQKLDEFIRLWRHFSGEPSAAPQSRRKRTTGNSDKDEIAKAVYDILVATGRAIPRGELVELIRHRGLILNGKDAGGVLTTMIWRSALRDKIVSDGHGYAVKQETSDGL